MKRLKLFDPVDQPLENMLQNFFGRTFLAEEGDRMRIRMDIAEDDNAYTVNAELPGVKKEDIHVSIEGNQVAISAEASKEEERKQDGRLLHRECYYGSLYRSFTLDQPVDDAKAAATYKDGVLKLVLPKSGGANVKHLTVQ